jgi:hypothetical protein
MPAVTRIGAYAAMIALAGYGVLLGLEEAVRIYVTRLTSR